MSTSEASDMAGTKCEDCNYFVEAKVFNSDGICTIVKKNRKFVRKFDSCRYGLPKERKEENENQRI